MGKGSWTGGGIEGNSARLQKVYLVKTELLSCRIFDLLQISLLFSVSSMTLFNWHFMEKKYCFNSADCLLAILSQLFSRVDCCVNLIKKKNSIFSSFPFSKVN